MNFPVQVQTTAADGSGTITAGGTAQNLFVGATPVNGYTVYNPDANNWLWINEGGTAAPNGSGSIGIAPLNIYETPITYKPYGVVSIYGTITTQPFTAKKY